VSRPTRALLVVATCLSWGIGLASPVRAADEAAVVVIEVGGAALPDLAAAPTIAAAIGAGEGGAGLLVTADPGRPQTELQEALAGSSPAGVSVSRVGSVSEVGPALAAALGSCPADDVLAIVVTTPPADDPPQLGAIVLVRAPCDVLLGAVDGGGARGTGSLTSDSTRRSGVVTSADVATTALDALGVERATGADPGGATIRVLDDPPPLELYRRYGEQRRLTVPVGVVAGLYALGAGIAGIVILARGARSSPALRSVTASAAVSVVPLAVALMAVGHLERLTYASALSFLAAVTLLGTLALVPARRAWGPLTALAAAGAAVLAVFVVEAAMSWTATLTPLLGGAQLDGGRFFGLPNVQIGLLMGASLYVAQRLPSVGTGVGVIVASALFAGSPWTGANIGAAVTLATAAGLWWGLRHDAGSLRPATALRVLGLVGVVVAAVIVAHRYLAGAPTHISRFAADTGGLAGLRETVTDRLEIGMDLIVRNPFGLVPVVGVLATLWVVLRPPASIRPGLERSPAWRDALLTILLASIAAYVVNDSGAAAIGLGFGTALGGLLYVSLSDPPAMMDAA
jgi:hypothetical protein